MVKCADCGFLALRDSATGQFVEANDEMRETGRPHQQLDVSLYPMCFKRVINVQQLAMDLPDSITGRDVRVLAVIQEKRECCDFAEWQPDFNPREHQEKIDREEERKFQDARLKEDREWRELQDEKSRAWQVQQEERSKEWQEQQAKGRLRWEVVIFGILVTLALLGGQILQAFVARGSLFGTGPTP